MIGRVGDKYRAECDICGEVVEVRVNSTELTGHYIGTLKDFKIACPIKRRYYPDGETIYYTNSKTGQKGCLLKNPNIWDVCRACEVHRSRLNVEQYQSWDFTIYDYEDEIRTYKTKMTIYDAAHTIGLYYGADWHCKFALTERYCAWLKEIGAMEADVYYLLKNGRVSTKERKDKVKMQLYLKEMCKGHRLKLIRTDYIRTDGGDTRKGFDTIVCEVTLGINTKEELKLFVKENAKNIVWKVLQKIETTKGFQKYGIPINFVKAERITVTNDCLAVCYFSLRELNT